LIEGRVIQPLLAPRNGNPELISHEAGFADLLDALKAGHGPLAIDAERASGYRYSQRAYLIQIFRRGGGIHLIDPIAVPNRDLWFELNRSFKDCEWIIHASTQDLPCLRELGIEPQILFDTELGARIAGCERVGLGPLTESLLELSLAKEHSAVDWSMRPLKAEWLTYAALDVDVLVDLRDKVAELLQVQGKLEWAGADFAQILKSPPTPPRVDPWRRTSGLHKVKDRTSLAIVRELWLVRDAYAKAIDVAPGRVFNDEVLVDLALKRRLTVDEFAKAVTKRSRLEAMPITEWFRGYQEAMKLENEQLPPLKVTSLGLPHIKVWKERNRIAHARLTHARSAVIKLADELHMPPENLVSPEVIRQLCWSAPIESETEVKGPDLFDQFIEGSMLKNGARQWQIDQLLPELRSSLRENEPLALEEAIDLETSGQQDETHI
jgi:ribonuclease D